MEFLHEFYKIPSNQPNDTHVYAMKKDVGNAVWIPRLQSTLYYSKIWQEGIGTPQLDTLENAPALSQRMHVLNFVVSRLSQCLELCADAAVSAVRALRTVRFDPTDKSCRCFDDSLFQWKFDSVDDAGNQLWTRDGDSKAEFYETKFCEFVRPDTVHSISNSYTTHTHTIRLHSTPFDSIDRFEPPPILACSTVGLWCGPRVYSSRARPTVGAQALRPGQVT